MHGVTYLAQSVLTAAAWSGASEDWMWGLAVEHCSTLLTYKLLGHSPRVAGRALCCLGWGASTWAALFEARRSLGLPALD